MTLTIEAIYDGKVFLPVHPLALKPNTHVQLSIKMQESEALSFLDVAQSLELDGPPDWSSKLDEYLYGDKVSNGS